MPRFLQKLVPSIDSHTEHIHFHEPNTSLSHHNVYLADMKFITFATNCLLGIATALPQGSIEKDAEWTVTNLTVHSQLSGLKLATS